MGSDKRVVIVEDDGFLMKMYEKKLMLDGFLVKAVTNGQDCLKICPSFLPDIIILDMMLPGMSGLEILEKLKKDEATKKIPVLILSNLSNEEKIKKGLELGAEEYLIKSNHLPSEVIEKVSEIIWKYKKSSI